MAKYIKTTFGELPEGACFWISCKTWGISILQRRKIDWRAVWMDGVPDGMPLDEKWEESDEVWIENTETA